MKKFTFSVAFAMLLQVAFAGGVLTNYNQSAQYIRMMSRNAALEIDAVFYNPAGLVKLDDGWHFGFSSQTIFQTREINSEFPFLNDGYYEGETTIAVFPDLYAAYKKGNWVFSLGVNPIGGGGTATFENGIPSLEIPISMAVPGLSGLEQIDPSLQVTGYDMEMYLDASSTYWGIQVGATYAINDKFSVFGGARIVPAHNNYDGYIRNIQLNAGGQMVNAQSWLSGAGSQVSGIAGQASAGSDMMYNTAGTIQPVIDAGYGTATLSQLVDAGVIDAATQAQIEGGLQLIGLPQAQIDMMNAGQVQGAYTSAGDELAATATVLTGTAQTLTATSDEMADREVKTKQIGMGITPIIGFHFSPNDDWNIGLKYEHKTTLTLENETEIDEMGLFPDGAETQTDIPGIFTAGVGYRGLDWLELQLSYNMYMDKGVDFGNNTRYLLDGEYVEREIDGNYHEIGLGLQFNLSDNFAISVGYLSSENNVGANYQSDFSFTNASNTLAGGFMWKITDKLTFDFGLSNTFYKDDTVTFTHASAGPYDETYGKTTINIAGGLSYSIF